MAERDKARTLLELMTKRIAVIAFCAFWTLPAFLISSTQSESPLYTGSGPTGAETMEQMVVAEPKPVEEGPPLYTVHKLVAGENIGKVAARYELNIDTIISVNGITSTRTVPQGKLLRIPNENGILYAVAEGDSVQSVAAKLEVPEQGIYEANGIAPGTAISAKSTLFVPGAKLDPFRLREINGELFRWPLPVRGYLSSYFGQRQDPFNTGAYQRHNGIDIATSTGTPVLAAMEGTVVVAAFTPVNGNYIIIAHHSGYKTFYGHLSAFKVKVGDYVTMGKVIALSGNTGLSTGSHLHFTVYKYGSPINPLAVLK